MQVYITVSVNIDYSTVTVRQMERKLRCVCPGA